MTILKHNAKHIRPYLKDLKLIVTAHVSQFLINTKKRILLCFEWLIIHQKKLRQSLSNLDAILPSPISKHDCSTHFTRPLTGAGGGDFSHYFVSELPSSFNEHSIVYSQPFFWLPNVQYLTGKLMYALKYHLAVWNGNDN